MPSPNYYNLQKAIYEKLLGNSQLVAVVGGIFDNPPQGEIFPFITLGDVSAGDVSSLESSIAEYRIGIDVWSREAGHKQTADIMDLVYATLHQSSITVSGKSFVSMRFVSSSIQLEDDGWTYHGSMGLSVILSGT